MTCVTCAPWLEVGSITVLVGHLAVGLGAKRVEPRISLGTLVLAAMLPDLLWALFMVAGVERVRFQPGVGAARYLQAIDIGWSHSLLMGVVWGALLAAAFYLARRRSTGSLGLWAVVLSHWLLDWASHTPDMPLAPGGETRLGLGLWTSVPWTLIVEGGLWLGAMVLYAGATRPRTRVGTYALWAGVAVVSLAWFNNVAGPPPPRPETAPIASLAFFSLIVAWAYWMERARPAATARP